MKFDRKSKDKLRIRKMFIKILRLKSVLLRLDIELLCIREISDKLLHFDKC